MVLAKKKGMQDLGRSLMNDNMGGANRKASATSRAGGMGAGKRKQNADGSEKYLTDKKEAGWVKMRSVTEQQALDDFLATAELADTDFTAEKMNVKIIHNDQKNPFLLSRDEETSALQKHRANAGKLTVPRRPKWNAKTTPAELERSEKESFLAWRRGLADLQDNNDLLLTPFERNLEVWRQLWRVIERSDLVVQIVDARNPLTFRSEDLENYVKEVDKKKNNLLLVNKADMMTLSQRQAWAKYFESQGVRYKFFSAALAKEKNEQEDSDIEQEEEEEEDDEPQSIEERAAAQQLASESEEEEEGDEEGDDEDYDSEDETEEEKKEREAESMLDKDIENLDVSDEHSEHDNEEHVKQQEEEEDTDPNTRIITVDELEQLFLEHAPHIEQIDPENPRKINIGLVGYPNVGKSSTINALIGAKKVSVSSTPGKTKHFQTIHLSEKVMLVDCPGLVFPNFATTKAELVCNGVLPIDQLREFLGPAGLVAQRIPQAFLEAMYGIKIHTRPEEEGGTGEPTASEVLVAYARARGFTKTGTGRNWDESRAARYVLKDYVNGKLLFCQPPPASPPIDPYEFNQELYDVDHIPAKRRNALLQTAAASDLTSNPDVLSPDTQSLASVVPIERGLKSNNLDQQFFMKKNRITGKLITPYQYVDDVRTQGTQTGPGKALSGRKARTAIALDKGLDPAETKARKKHFKDKRAKRRTDTIND